MIFFNATVNFKSMKIKVLLKNIIINFKFIRTKISSKNVNFNLFKRIKVLLENDYLNINQFIQCICNIQISFKAV